MEFMRKNFGSRVGMWPMQFDLEELSCVGCLCFAGIYYLWSRYKKYVIIKSKII